MMTVQTYSKWSHVAETAGELRTHRSSGENKLRAYYVHTTNIRDGGRVHFDRLRNNIFEKNHLRERNHHHR